MKLRQAIIWFVASTSTMAIGAPGDAPKAKPKPTKPATVPAAVTAEPAPTINEAEFGRLYRFYKAGSMKPRALWEKLVNVGQDQNLPSHLRLTLTQMQSDLLVKAKLPVLGAAYAVSALKMAQNPENSTFDPSWYILYNVSKKRPIQYLIDDLALNVRMNGVNPNAFGNDWNYHVANAHANKGQDDKAESFYRRINQSSRYFMPSRYQLGMIAYERGDYQEAAGLLKAVLMPTTRESSPLSDKDQKEMWDYANMGLGRIYYEQKQFLTSARYYRMVYKDSPLFYDALYEQSWALFMSGNPKHALGSLYGASSPYYEDIYNPEAKVLESTVYFWMCRYTDSRNSLADFAVKYSEAVEKLSAFVERNQFNPETAYRLFENLVTGVSGESLGIPRDVLNSAASRDTMLLVRDQLATVLTEIDRLNVHGVYGSKDHLATPLSWLTSIRDRLQYDLGVQFIKELRNEKAHYEQLYSQSQFLYLELLMSEKEQLLGHELHASTKVSEVSEYNDIRGWGRNTQSWKGEKKGEFWWDEIGFHIVDVDPKCVEN